MNERVNRKFVISTIITSIIAILVCLPSVSAFSVELQQRVNNSVILFIGSPKAFVNCKETQIDTTNISVTPLVQNDRTLVPVRFISEGIGSTVSFNNSTNEISVTLKGKNIKLVVGSNKININGVIQDLDVPAQDINDRTFIPLRSLVEALGKKIFWDERGLIIISDNENIFYPELDSNLISTIIDKFVFKGCSNSNAVNDSFVVQQGEWIFYSNDRKNLTRSKIDGTDKLIISDSFATNINIVGDWLYCTLTNYNGERYSNLGFYKIKTDGSEKIKISDDSMGNIIIVKDWVYFTDSVHGLQMFKMKLDGTSKQNITTYPAKNLNVIGDYIYFQNDENQMPYSIKTDGSELKKIIGDNSYDLYLNYSDGWLYYDKEGDKYGLYKIKPDGKGRKQLDSKQISYINVIDDYIYYHIYDDGLYRIKTDGTSKKKLCSDYAAGINVIGDWIFYQKYNTDNNKFEFEGIYRIKNDGSGRMKI